MSTIIYILLWGMASFALSLYLARAFFPKDDR